MSNEGVDQDTLYAWLFGRSIARGHPAPIADRGGYRVDTNSDVEVSRWVFSRIGAGLVELAGSIGEPRYFLKLCGTNEELRSTLTDRWQLHESRYFMQAIGTHDERPIAPGYAVELDQCGEGVVEVRVTASTGELAASGYAAETQNAFIYDRIATMPGHRRLGLGGAVMSALRRAKQSPATPELLVATEDGRALYVTLGWRVISLYSTASIPAPNAGLQA